MDYSKDTPFKTYQEIKEAIRTKKATISFDRTFAYNIASKGNTFVILFNLIIPIISIILMWIVCSIFGVSKWVLLFAIATLLLYTFVPHLKGVFWLIAIIAIALPLILHKAIWLMAIGAGIVGMMIGYYIWWGVVSAKAIDIVFYSEDVFEDLWKTGKFALRTDNTFNGFHRYGTGDLKEQIKASGDKLP